MLQRERIAGGLYGLLVGDALGVPYEFYEAKELPVYEKIEMTPPSGFRKTYPKIAAGTWSDDGAQALCLMDSLLKHGKFSLKAYSDALLAWYEEGFWAVEGVVFDVGIQTADALNAYKGGIPAKDCGLMNPEGKGNGALMRVLPLALWHFVQGNTDLEKRSRELVRDAYAIRSAALCIALWPRRSLRGRRSGRQFRRESVYFVPFTGNSRSMNGNWNGVSVRIFHGRAEEPGTWWIVSAAPL